MSPAGDTKKQARERAKALREEQERKARRSERMVRMGVAVAVVVALVGVGVAWQSSRRSVDDTAALPATVTEPGGGVVFGSADAPVTIDVWADFQCPACAQWESVNAQTLAEAVEAGTLKYVAHPLSFLDDRLGNTSSALATNVFGCAVSEAEPAQALAFHDLVFANQPPENPGQPAWTEADLLGWAAQAGVEGDAFETCVRDTTYAGWVDNVAASMADAGVTGTPTIFLDGAKLEASELNPTLQDPAALQRLLDEAAAS